MLILSLLFVSSSLEFLKVFSSSGTKIFTGVRCYGVLQDVLELQFGEGNFLTLQTQLFSRHSRLKLEFLVTRRSLHSGVLWEFLFFFFLFLFFFQKREQSEKQRLQVSWEELGWNSTFLISLSFLFSNHLTITKSSVSRFCSDPAPWQVR